MPTSDTINWPGWISSSIAAAIFLWGLISQIFGLKNTLKRHDERLDAAEKTLEEHEEVMISFKDKCLLVSSEVDQSLKEDDHTHLCKENTTTILEAFRDSNAEQNHRIEHLAQSVEGNRNFVSDELRKISRFMGRMEGWIESHDLKPKRRKSDIEDKE